MTNQTHTPGKLHVSHNGKLYGSICGKPLNYDVATPNGYTSLEREANAERLALCWNSHDALLAALTEIEGLLDCGNIEQSHWDDCLNIARAALKLAKE